MEKVLKEVTETIHTSDFRIIFICYDFTHCKIQSRVPIKYL
jgi:hypothetical protein